MMVEMYCELQTSSLPEASLREALGFNGTVLMYRCQAIIEPRTIS